jgi:hypothetical protein
MNAIPTPKNIEQVGLQLKHRLYTTTILNYEPEVSGVCVFI